VEIRPADKKHDPRAAGRKWYPKTAERKQGQAAQPESLLQDGGIGGQTLPLQSAHVIQVVGPKGRKACICPSFSKHH